MRERERVQRIGLALLAASISVVGVWALLAPRSFYDSFPGGGRHWVRVDGPFNEHLVRDVGSLNLALVLLLVVAAVRLDRALVRTAAAAAILTGAPHLLYHLFHLEPLPTADKVANVVSLGLGVLLPIVVLLATVGAPGRDARDEPLHTGE